VKPIGADKYPLFCDVLKAAQFMEAPRAILKGDPYPVKALLVLGASILTSLPNPNLWKECFRNLDFMVVFDRFMTGDAMYADILLPATTNFENLGTRDTRGVLPAPAEGHRADRRSQVKFLFLAQLAGKLGYGDLFPATEEERIRFAFKEGPVSLEDLKAHPEGVRYDAGRMEYRKHEKGLLRSDGKPGFNTPSKKVELVSSMLQKYGYERPCLFTWSPQRDRLAASKLYEKYPLVLNTGARLQSAFRSQHLNIPGLLKLQPKPQVLIHPKDAEARGIPDGDRVWVESLRGKVAVRAG